MYLSLVNSQINAVSAEPSNKVYLKVEVKNKNGLELPGIKVLLSIDNNNGSIYPQNSITDKSGECIAVYTPPYYYSPSYKNEPFANITVKVAATEVSNSLKIKLLPVPVVLIHGYQQNSDIFDNMREYLEQKGFICSAIDYDSSLGISYAANKLEDFLGKQKELFLQQGFLVKRFTLITHSMGGLVARYYTSSESYIKNEDVNKIIFLSVPHKGSYLASIGENYFNDKSMEDLIPESKIFTTSFSNMINKGLNSSIQVGNILSQYDEVVTAESGSLEEWSLETEIFNLGENNFTVDNILSGS
ncbi:MAG: alpha/beta hydrolase, partial [Clostridiaceae bacterium]|nr:alpha/beta hydrolase [Clostridiaceae bacterium]